MFSLTKCFQSKCLSSARYRGGTEKRGTLVSQDPPPRAWPPVSEASPVVGLLATETLQEYLKVVMALTYEEKPPYATLRSRLGAVLQDLRVSTYDPVDLQRVP